MKSLLGSFLTILSCAAFSCVAQAQEVLSLQVSAIVKSEPIAEISGIVKSRARDDLYWVHNDKGDKARIFAINGKGLNVIPTYSKFSYYGEDVVKGKDQWQGFKVLFAENIDWEDMAVDDNYLYIADMGNNGNDRQDLGIYIISEIDPTASTQSASIKHIPVSYPDQKSFPANKWHFDSESLFSADDKLYVITKHRVAGEELELEAGAKLYRLDTEDSDMNNVLTLIDQHSEIKAATSADLSPDGTRLAVLSYTALWLFDRPASGDAWFSSSYKKYALDEKIAKKAEALTWENDESILLINEEREMFRLNLREI